jgi:hypothetical protein
MLRVIVLSEIWFIVSSAVLMIIYTVLFSFWNFAPPTYAPLFPLPGLMMSKVYSNSMLVLLNNRTTVVTGGDTVESFEFVEVSPLEGLEPNCQTVGTGTVTGRSSSSDVGHRTINYLLRESGIQVPGGINTTRRP